LLRHRATGVLPRGSVDGAQDRAFEIHLDAAEWGAEASAVLTKVAAAIAVVRHFTSNAAHRLLARVSDFG
jgi:hypothetical protein